jgi:hypothetical protein
LLFSASLAGCWYSFVPDGIEGGRAYALKPSTNSTALLEAGMVLDENLERTLSSMGMLAPKGEALSLHCTLVSYSSHSVTSSSLTSDDRYRLTIRVRARVLDEQGKELWGMSFSDQGAYPEEGSEEDGIDEACRGVSLQIARALAALEL